MNKYICIFLCYFSFIPIFVYASQSSGTIDSTYHFAKLCHDATCTTNSSQINFLPTIGTNVIPVTIDDTNGIDGTAWGAELGWITFGRIGTTSVTFSDTTTGSTTGYAWSQVSGWINMSPTGYGVKINSNGEFQGYAWSGGPSGGWINFDCTGNAAATCVKTDWRPVPARNAAVIPPSGGGGGGGGGGGFVIPTGTTTASTTPSKDNSIYKTQTGSQNQKTDYTSEFRADINDSGVVDLMDFNLVIVNWGRTSHVDMSLAKIDRCAKTLAADVNCDGGVDALDFNLIMVYWGQYVGQQGIDLKLKTNTQLNKILHPNG